MMTSDKLAKQPLSVLLELQNALEIVCRRYEKNLFTMHSPGSSHDVLPENAVKYNAEFNKAKAYHIIVIDAIEQKIYSLLEGIERGSEVSEPQILNEETSKKKHQKKETTCLKN